MRVGALPEWRSAGAGLFPDFGREDFLRVGGFKDNKIWEDWSLWLRMWKAGADVQPSLAVYIQNVNPNGRNSQFGTLEENELRMAEIRAQAGIYL